MTKIKGLDPIHQKTQPHESRAKKTNLAKGVIWAMIGVGLAALFYFIFMFILAGARA